MINIGYAPANWPSTLELADRHPEIEFVLGLHPGHADEWSEQVFADLTELVSVRRPVAIGEIGIDYYWTDENKATQRVSFERQIELAHGRDLPVVIHQRSAARDVESVLRNAPETVRVILHSFDGDPALADLAEERGWFLGIGGLSTRRQSELLRSRLPLFPVSQLILETDSPYLIPSGVKSRRNEPCHLPLIAERLAGLIHMTIEDVARITSENAGRAFGLSVGATAR
jgi:TatD DNase family protein